MIKNIVNSPTDVSKTRREIIRQITDTIPPITNTHDGFLIASLKDIKLSKTTDSPLIINKQLKIKDSMKFTQRTASIIALFLVFIMVGSTVAFSILQSVRSPKTELELPSTNIVNYELKPEVESYLIQNGKMIIKFDYALACVECLNRKAFLESVANQFSDQIVLVEIVTNEDTPSLTAISIYGQRSVGNVTEEEVVNVLCDLMINPPVFCAMRNV